VDKHIGRARSDFQTRVQQLVRDLRTAATAAYTLRQGQLQQALDAARHQLEHADDFPPGEDPATREERLQALARRLDLLLAPPARP